jgi:hypothetical protein
MEISPLVVKANSVFTPGYPVHQKDFFSGRVTQLQRTLEALIAPGRHPVLFGQRGVGKTSLANILGQSLQGVSAVKVSCDSGDTFATIWNRVLATASVTFKQQALGFVPKEATKTVTLASLLGHDPKTTKPAEVASLLTNLNHFCAIILDEFDKVADVAAKAHFADFIKIVSDSVPNFTIIFVGVADNIHELVGEHPSIDRNLVQIELPLMSDEEIREIFVGGLKRIDVTVEDGVSDQVPMLSGGFPHYAHLLGLCAARACVDKVSQNVDSTVFDLACQLAVQDAIEKFRDGFARATATTQASRYPYILAACGYAASDGRGVFRATDVVDAMGEVFNTPLAVQAVVPALGEFTKGKRGQVLKAVQVGGKQCYRFSDPMMRPFTRLKARELLL